MYPQLVHHLVSREMSATRMRCKRQGDVRAEPSSHRHTSFCPTLYRALVALSRSLAELAPAPAPAPAPELAPTRCSPSVPMRAAFLLLSIVLQLAATVLSGN